MDLDQRIAPRILLHQQSRHRRISPASRASTTLLRKMSRPKVNDLVLHSLVRSIDFQRLLQPSRKQRRLPRGMNGMNLLA